MRIEWIIGIFAFLAFLMVKAVWDERNYKKKTVRTLKKEWGHIKDERCSYEKMQSIGSYYQTIREDSVDVDDTTWNDLDMEEVFYRLNHTESAMGEEYLYAAIRKPLFPEEELKERNRVATFFMESEEPRIRIQMVLRKMGKLKNISLHEYINKTVSVDHNDTMKHVLCDVALLVSIGLTLLVSFAFAFLAFGVIMVNMILYFKRKAEIEKYYSFLSSILRILYGVDALEKINIPEIGGYTKRLIKAKKAFRKFRKGSFLVFSGRNGNESIVDFIMNYLQIALHLDLIKFNSMMKEVKRNRDALNEIFCTVGSLDLGIAIASFRTYLGDAWCRPELTHEREPFIEAVDIFHPLIEDPVHNSIYESKSTLLTGSNASGKSTFLKTVAINAILSQTMDTALCSKYRANYFKVFSSMALRDDIFSKESYFIVEIKSLKRIIDHMDDGVPMLCLIDEVLRGTNTLERIASSSQILRHISTCNALCFAATHDVELTYILENQYSNYHFTEQVVENEVLFDYHLYQGRATSRNAIKLLGIIGYQKEMIDQATEEANCFMKEGKWRVL